MDGTLTAGACVAAALIAAVNAHDLLLSPRQIEVGAAVALAVIGVLYQVLFFALARNTPGMKYAHISLCTFDDQIPTGARRLGRLGALFLSLLPWGWEWRGPSSMKSTSAGTTGSRNLSAQRVSDRGEERIAQFQAKFVSARAGMGAPCRVTKRAGWQQARLRRAKSACISRSIFSESSAAASMASAAASSGRSRR